jgi:hypothetical protein
MSIPDAPPPPPPPPPGPPSSRGRVPAAPPSSPSSERKVYDIEPDADSIRKPPQSAQRSTPEPRSHAEPGGGLPGWLTLPLIVLGLLAIPAIAWLVFSDDEPRKPRTASRFDARNDVDEVDDEAEDDDEHAEEHAPPTPTDPAPTEEAAPETKGVRGFVVQGEKVVPNAMVRCNKPGEEERITSTMANGQFFFPNEADGCMAVAQSGRFGKSAPVELRRGGDNRIEMPGQGSVSGTVVDERGLAVQKFLVNLDHAVLADGELVPGGTQRSIDDAEGRFSLENLAAGTWTLLVSAAGRPATKVEVRIESGHNTENVRVRLERGATLLGSVIDRNTKRPIGGARVTLDEGERVSAIEPATTSPGGDFRLEGLPTGAFSIEVQHPDYLARIVSGLDAKNQRQMRLTIDLAPGGDAGGTMEMSGIGASLSADGQRRVVVRSVREDGPAEKAGMQADDVILTIDGKSAEGFDVQQCVQLLRGPPGTDVAVTVGRDGNPIGMTIVRETIVQ